MSSRVLLFVFLAGIAAPHAAYSVGLFANIKRERAVMVSRDAMQEYIDKQRVKDPDFQYVRGIRYFSGNSVSVDVFPQFLELDPKLHNKTAAKILDAWRFSKPTHIQSANIELYVLGEHLPFYRSTYIGD
jgi:uncharacterized protein YneR